MARTLTRTHTRNRLLKTQMLAIATSYEPSKWGKFAALIDRLVESRAVRGLSVIGVNGKGEIEQKVSYRINWDEHDRLVIESPRPYLPRDWNGEVSPEVEKALQYFDAMCHRERLRPQVQFRIEPGTDLAAFGLVRAPIRKWAAGVSKRARTTITGLEETEIMFESIELNE